MRQGFTLIELSIVLVIIGLIVSGILVGQNLIRAAELRAVTTESQQYITAAHAFKDKYRGLPGDISNATFFWGKDNTNCSADTGTAATPGTCNGNRDGMIGGAAAAAQTGERYQFWKQLALAGLIGGDYTGIAGPANAANMVRGTNAPASKVRNAGWSVFGLGQYGGDASTYAGDYGNAFLLGIIYSNEDFYDPAFTPEEAWNIDTKMDDGKPGLGKIIARHWYNFCGTGGSSASDVTNSVYNVTQTGNRCALNFVKQF